jgi:hypothetical protein
MITGMATSFGLLVIDDDGKTNSNVILGGNTVRNQSPLLPAVAIFLAERCATTGNIIANEQLAGTDQRGPSLQLFQLNEAAAATSAVTGNVFKGKAQLPPRPPLNPAAPAPMDTWHFFNAES